MHAGKKICNGKKRHEKENVNKEKYKQESINTKQDSPQKNTL